MQTKRDFILNLTFGLVLSGCASSIFSNLNLRGNQVEYFMNIYDVVETPIAKISKTLECPTIQELVEFFEADPLNFLAMLIPTDQAWMLRDAAANNQYIRQNADRCTVFIGYEHLEEKERQELLNGIVDNSLHQYAVAEQQEEVRRMAAPHTDESGAIVFPETAANE